MNTTFVILECVPPMKYFNCSNSAPGSTGSECQKSCQTLDMACVSYCFWKKAFRKSYRTLTATITGIIIIISS